jgi:hypothetical protein
MYVCKMQGNKCSRATAEIVMDDLIIEVCIINHKRKKRIPLL